MSSDRTNVAMYVDSYEKIKKENESIPKDKRPSMVQHTSDIVDSHYRKQLWLKEKYAPHIEFVSSDKTSIVLRDNHLDGKLLEVRYRDNRIWCSECKPDRCMHVFYAVARPEIAQLVDLDGKKK